MYHVTLEQLEEFSPANFQYDVRDQLKQHVYDRSVQAFRTGDAARDAITTVAALRSRQKFIRRKFLECIGGLPAGGELNARVTGVVNGAGFRIEKVIFESRPNHFVTANLYVPDNVQKPTGAVLFLCGHLAEAKHCDEYQAVCQTLTSAGLVVLAQDPIGQGERYGYYDPESKTTDIGPSVGEHEYAGAQCVPLGHSLARYFLHDAMRGVDYLMTRPEVDPKCIGVTGNSGGGLQTAMMMMGDGRIAAAAPGTFIMNRETYIWTGGAQDAEQVWPGFSAHGLDHEDILLAMCPKPVRVLAVRWDFFPLEGVRRTVERCSRLWKLAGKPDLVDLVEDDSTHCYTPVLARAAAQFFSRHLLKRELGDREIPVSVFEPSLLWCTKSGQVRGELPGAKFTHEANLDELKNATDKRRQNTPEQRRARALKTLRRQVTSHRRPCAPLPRFSLEMETTGELIADRAWWWSQEGIVNCGVVLRETKRRGETLPVSIAIWDGGCTRIKAHNDWIQMQLRRGRAVCIMEPTAMGSLAARPLTAHAPEGLGGVYQKLSTDLEWLGDSLAAMRVWDVLRALDVLALWPRLNALDIEGYAHGRSGLYLQIACALDARVKKLKVVDGLGSYEKWVKQRYYGDTNVRPLLLPGVLQHFDLPDLVVSGRQGKAASR